MVNNKDCPFCKEGNDKLKVALEKEPETNRFMAQVICVHCNATGPLVYTFGEHAYADDLYEMAIDLWNTRGSEENG